MEFRPCIDLHNGKVKQIIGATLTDKDNSAAVNFESTLAPSYYANLYKKDALRGGHVIKLGPNNEDAAKDALAAWPGGIQIGGGITAENAQYWIDAGASHVIVTSYVFKDGQINFENLAKLYDSVGKKHIVLDLSCKELNGEYLIVTDRWQNFTTTVLSRETFDVLSSYCDEFLVHAATVEGLKGGADLNLVALLAELSPIPVTYAGGIASMEHIEQVRVAGDNRVAITIGSALDIFGGELPYDSVVAACRR